MVRRIIRKGHRGIGLVLWFLTAGLLSPSGAAAQNVSFDLIGPKVDVRVQEVFPSSPVDTVEKLATDTPGPS